MPFATSPLSGLTGATPPAVSRKPYPSDISDEQWSLVVPYRTLMKDDAPLRELFNGLRYVSRHGIA
jgi:hypothetical protein